MYSKAEATARARFAKLLEAMRVRLRKLEGKFDAELYRETVRSIRAETLSGKQASRRAPNEAPVAVDAEELEVDFDEACELVRRGEVKLSDLVDTGEGWEVIEDAVAFFDIVEPLRRKARLVRTLALAGAVVVLLASPIFVFVLPLEMRDDLGDWGLLVVMLVMVAVAVTYTLLVQSSARRR